MAKRKEDRRRAARRPFGGQVAGQMHPGPEVSVVDLSLDGALIEHADLLRAGTLASVTLWLPGREVTFQCRVIRSLIHREEVSPTGAREVIYHTGLKFLDVSEIARRVLEECLASGGRGGADPDPA